MLKELVIEMMENDHKRGYRIAELADALKADAVAVQNLVVKDCDFFYDGNNPYHIGWRLDKYR